MEIQDKEYRILNQETVAGKGEKAEIRESREERIVKLDKKGQELVWYLKRSLYGLRQSPRCFYNKLVRK